MALFEHNPVGERFHPLDFDYRAWKQRNHVSTSLDLHLPEIDSVTNPNGPEEVAAWLGYRRPFSYAWGQHRTGWNLDYFRVSGDTLGTAMKVNPKWHLLLAIGIGLVSAECRCQHSCQIDYGNENQIDYNLRSRVGVSGSITLPNSSPVPHVCVAVFTDDTHQFVLGRTSDSKGQFNLPLLPNKTYRLVVRVSPFGVANARLRIVPEDRADQPLHVHIKPRGIDTTSYIDTD